MGNKDANTMTVIGYGSLLSEASARETVKSLGNFRLVSVPGFRRVFNKVGIVFFERFRISPDDICISSCSTRADADTAITCCAFECSAADFIKIYDREHRFRWIDAEFVDANGATGIGRMCTEYNDTDYRLNKCVTDDEYEFRVGRFYHGKIWRDDILPFPVYLRHCIEAASSHGIKVYENFVRSSFLADGVTTIEDYIAENENLLTDEVSAYTYAGGV